MTDKVNVTIPFDRELRDEVKTVARWEDRQMADFIRVAVRERVAKLKAARSDLMEEQPTAQHAGAA